MEIQKANLNFHAIENNLFKIARAFCYAEESAKT
jgi:hypothetical protein